MLNWDEQIGSGQGLAKPLGWRTTSRIRSHGQCFPLSIYVYSLIMHLDRDTISLAERNKIAPLDDERRCHWATTYSRQHIHPKTIYLG